jgi:hypothetical protein
MNRIIVLAIFIFLLNKIFSQKYQPVDSTTVWATNYYYKTNPYYCYESQNLKYFSKGYELNNGNIWLKIQFSAQNYSNSTPSNPNCVNSNWFSNGFMGYLFNDTINKRVFFRPVWLGSLPPNHIPEISNSNTNELIYDFNKVVGDSMYVNSIVKFEILSIDSILFSGKYHKRFLTVATPSINTLNTNISFIEGIGSSIDPFEPFKADGFESGSKLLCFASPTQSMSVTNHTVFTNGGCANLVLNIKETEIFGLNIYPNPASDHISVVLDQNSVAGTNYKVVNLLGQEKLTGTLKETKNDIDLVDLKSGIYFINFYKNDQFVLCKKIVIQ